MRVRTSRDAPQWAVALAQDAEDAIRAPCDAPLRLQTYADAAALPLAAQWRHGLVFVTDIGMVAVSDGLNWKRLDTGATL